MVVDHKTEGKINLKQIIQVFTTFTDSKKQWKNVFPPKFGIFY